MEVRYELRMLHRPSTSVAISYFPSEADRDAAAERMYDRHHPHVALLESGGPYRMPTDAEIAANRRTERPLVIDGFEFFPA